MKKMTEGNAGGNQNSTRSARLKPGDMAKPFAFFKRMSLWRERRSDIDTAEEAGSIHEEDTVLVICTIPRENGRDFEVLVLKQNVIGWIMESLLERVT